MSSEFSSLLISLDCIFDTRLATLIRLDQKIDMSYYRNRPADTFSGLPRDEFIEAYNKRDKDTLRISIPTPLINMLKNFSLETIKNGIGSPFNYKPKIILNTYPYDLTIIERKNILESLIASTKNLSDLELVDMPLEEITPFYIKKNVSVFISYEPMDWLEYHSDKGLKECQSPDITLLGPKIYFVEPTTNYKSIENTENDEFRKVQLLASVFINLEFIDIKNFCALGFENL